MNRWMGFLSVALLLTAAACSGITANANLAPGANPAAYHTYAWYTPPNGQAASPAEQEVRAALQRDLAQKGMVPATTEPPDFLVAYHATREQKIEAYGGYGWWGGFPSIDTYTEGTLVVDFIDPKTNNVFWRGSAKGVVDNPGNPNLGKIDTAVAKIVDRYPAPMAASTSRPAM